MKSYIPRGCDQQGRIPEAADVPAPAEAATEIGADDPPLHNLMRVVLGDLAIAAALVTAVAIVVLVVAAAWMAR